MLVMVRRSILGLYQQIVGLLGIPECATHEVTDIRTDQAVSHKFSIQKRMNFHLHGRAQELGSRVES